MIHQYIARVIFVGKTSGRNGAENCNFFSDQGLFQAIVLVLHLEVCIGAWTKKLEWWRLYEAEKKFNDICSCYDTMHVYTK